MSRIGRKPIYVPVGIDVIVGDKYIILSKNSMIVKKKKEFFLDILYKNRLIYIKNKNNCNFWNLIGTYRSILNNIVIGLDKGYEKKLILVGVGYKALVKDEILFLYVGFSHSIKYNIPKCVNIICSKSNEIIIKGIDKQLVGQVASRIRSYKVPEPYKKGKGIRYYKEVVKIKESKKKIK